MLLKVLFSLIASERKAQALNPAFTRLTAGEEVVTTQFSTRKLSVSLLVAPPFHSGLCKALFDGVKSRGNQFRLPRVPFL